MMNLRSTVLGARALGWLLITLVLASLAPGCHVPAPSAPPAAPPISGPRLSWSFSYDDAGRLMKSTDPAGRSTTIRHELHPNGRVRRSTMNLADGTGVTRDFDVHGRIERAVRGDRSVELQYDGFDQLESIRATGAPEVRSTYDTLGRLSTRTIEKQKTSLHYDVVGRLKDMSTPWGVITYAYQTSEHTILRTLPTKHRTQWKYDTRGRLRSIEHWDPSGRLLARFSYKQGPDDRLLSIEEASGDGTESTSYEYNSVGYLTRVRHSNRGEYEFEYDSMGNRTAIRFPDGTRNVSTYDWAGRLLFFGGKECRHDEIANLSGCNAVDAEYSHGADGLLSRVRRSSTTVTYERDAFGSLAVRAVNGRRWTFLQDPLMPSWQPLVAVDDAAKKTFFLWDESHPLGVATAEGVKFYLEDHLGSARLVVDAKGISSLRRYEPFGNPTGPISKEDLEPGFAGMLFDGAAGLYLTNARTYAPHLGRFLERDPQMRTPSASPEGWSAYSYCANDPVNSVDPSGAATDLATVIRNAKHVEYILVDKIDFGKLGLTSTPGFRGGLNGGEDTIFLNHLLAHEDQKNGWTLRNVGRGVGEDGRPLKEGYLPPLEGVGREEFGGRKKFLDVVLVKGDRVRIYTTQSTDKQGVHDEFMQDLHLVAKLQSYGVNYTVRRYDPTIPTNVGGVSLRGSGDALRNIGQLNGVALDPNGRMVLLTKDGTNVQLPAIELDDIVTVFRSVYEFGEAPAVSIDPDPKNPDGPTGHVWHGRATAGTYVGWILFEADRVMKSYALGVDNVTGAPVTSSIPGYDKVAHTTRRLDPGRSSGRADWGRYWITPASVEERTNRTASLSLLDVALKVNTESMELQGGQVVTAKNPTPSPARRAFASWFTENYGSLEELVVSKLPPNHHRSYDRVKVFAELRRITLLTAVAERLRDDGVPMPTWMMTHRREPFPIPETTPIRPVERHERSVDFQVKGGVSLELPRKDWKRMALPTTATAPDARVTAGGLVESATIESGGAKYRAVALPGATTKGVGASVLRVTDISLPIGEDQELDLQRTAQSYFEPSGELGRMWTLDLPVLVPQYTPTEQHGRRLLQQVYQLTSPLETQSVRFARMAKVPELGGSEALIPTTPGMVLGLVPSKENVVYFRGNRELSFLQSGQIQSEKRGPFTIRYRWDKKGRLSAKEAWKGASQVAAIALDYDAEGRIVTAKGSNGVRVRYDYGSDGFLRTVSAPGGESRYSYANGRITEVYAGGKPVRRISYDGLGRVQEETADGRTTRYTYSATVDGIEVIATDVASGRQARKRFDSSMRHTHEQTINGDVLQWEYARDGSVRSSHASRMGDRWELDETAGGRLTTVRNPSGGSWSTEHDSEGRVTAVVVGGRRALNVTRSGGLVQRIDYESAQVVPTYAPDGRVTELFIGEPGKRLHSDWLQVRWDDAAGSQEIRDASGYIARITATPARGTETILLGPEKLEVRRDAQGRATMVETSWGERETFTYTGAGDRPVRAMQERDGKKSSIELDDGLPTTFSDYNGNTTTLIYGGAGEKRRILRVQLPNGATLEYAYYRDDALEVTCGSSYRIRYQHDRAGRISEVTIAPPANP